MDFFLILTVFIFAFNLYAAIDIVAGTRQMKDLGDTDPLPEGKRPKE